jgi:hypothetical protein
MGEYSFERERERSEIGGRSSWSLLLRGIESVSRQCPLVFMKEDVIGINLDLTLVGRSVKLLLAFASRVIPGFKSPRGSCPRYLVSSRHVIWFSVNLPCLTADRIENTQGCYEFSSILFPICTVATAVKSMCICCGGVSLTLMYQISILVCSEF